ncbi:hypothetical protein BO70DRAFT_134709 [Aspergillus heteromorphus CBS 117.55]|uniref:Uncharacterized protein n=1 Tax=Aspergillus heteromorphus CBS 117.55 TaxID=1448321 RepID=A0A317WUM3_9EURO|nr:uncharacterized protein BO70DRAFT_134709 [Aspergillus heteromorphus CBS 117.55]PWY90123.1 hypothetical protein BO70DRAFT_134709 [Aspergillus heteromorphus CBS 117.55]
MRAALYLRAPARTSLHLDCRGLPGKPTRSTPAASKPNQPMARIPQIGRPIVAHPANNIPSAIILVTALFHSPSSRTPSCNIRALDSTRTDHVRTSTVINSHSYAPSTRYSVSMYSVLRAAYVFQAWMPEQ